MKRLVVSTQRIKISKLNNQKGDSLIKTLIPILILLMTNASHAHNICDDSMSQEKCEKAIYITMMEEAANEKAGNKVYMENFVNETKEQINEMRRKIIETEPQLIKLKTELEVMKSNPNLKLHCINTDSFIDPKANQLCTNNGYIQDLPALYLTDQKACNKVYMENFVNETKEQINEMRRKIIETEPQLIKLKTELTEMKNNSDYKPRCIVFGYFFSLEIHQFCTNNGYIQDSSLFYCPDTQEEWINFLEKQGVTEEELKKFLERQE